MAARKDHGGASLLTNLAKVRVARGLTQARLAEAVGISLRSLGRLEATKEATKIRHPRLTWFMNLAIALEVELEQILEQAAPKQESPGRLRRSDRAEVDVKPSPPLARSVSPIGCWWTPWKSSSPPETGWWEKDPKEGAKRSRRTRAVPVALPRQSPAERVSLLEHQGRLFQGKLVVDRGKGLSSADRQGTVVGHRIEGELLVLEVRFPNARKLRSVPVVRDRNEFARVRGRFLSLSEDLDGGYRRGGAGDA